MRLVVTLLKTPFFPWQRRWLGPEHAMCGEAEGGGALSLEKQKLKWPYSGAFLHRGRKGQVLLQGAPRKD